MAVVWRTMRRPSLSLILLATACDPGDVVLLGPAKGAIDTPTLTIHVVVDTPYAPVGDLLGWTAGVPAAPVRVHRMTEPYSDNYWHAAAADTVGVARLADPLGGLYEVEVTRLLSDAEMAQTVGTARVFAGGRRMYVSPGAEQTVVLMPDRRGSLIFSEIHPFVPWHYETGGTEYTDAKYIEIFNNADTVVYLDGKYLGMGWDRNHDYVWSPCSETAVVRNDPAGVWTERILRFPGGGTDYPIPPGAVALIAKSAIDHRSVHPGFDDLSAADFEWGGARNADNPDVPNLEDVGLRPMHFHFPGGSGMPVFLAEPVALQTLARYVDPYSGNPWVRIPYELVLDVFAGVGDQSAGQYTYAQCLEVTHRHFERLPGPATAFADFYQGLSIQRRVLYVLPDGRKVLQDTDTSMEDFVKAVRSPGWVRDSLP
jgi:hypothetical protein